MLPRTEMVSKPAKGHRQEIIHEDRFTPRPYQVELLDKALEKNTIVCLGTGKGKTFIGIMLLKMKSNELRKPFDEGGKRTIFLVPTTPLVEQQAKAIRLHTDCTVGEYIGAMAVDLWTGDKWLNEFRENQVAVMTPQILSDILLHGFLSLSKINLLIFDECHLAVKNHPYVNIMKMHSTCTDHPSILGLTAAILNSKCKSELELEKVINTLELTLRSRAVTSSDMIALDAFGTRPVEHVIEVNNYNDVTGLVSEFGDIISDALHFMYSCDIDVNEEDGDRDPRALAQVALQECQVILHSLGPWCAAHVAKVFIKQLSLRAENEHQELTQLFIQMSLTIFRMIFNIFEERFENNASLTLEDFHNFLHPKVLELIKILYSYKPENDFVIEAKEFNPDFPENDYMAGAECSDEDMDETNSNDSFQLSDEEPAMFEDDLSRFPMSPLQYVAKKKMPNNEEGSDPNKEDDSMLGIVFVERRHVAYTLNKLLQELCIWDEKLYFIKSSHVMGHGNKGDNPEAKMMQKRLDDSMRKFRTKEINLLVSTSVLEEGLDVPKCNLIVRFDLPKTYRAYVQSKGRARSPNSKYHMLICSQNECDATFLSELEMYRGFEKILMEKCCQRNDHDEEEMDNHLDNDLIPPYIPFDSEDSPRVTMQSSIALVNRYCAKLPSDAFTNLTPKCRMTKKIHDGMEMYQCKLQLPINSVVKEPIIGDPMPSKKLSKQAVALKTCRILHEANELDNRLLPVGKEVVEYEEDSDGDDNFNSGIGRTGTTRKKQNYYKKNADAFVDSRPEKNKQSYLYHINMVLTNPISDEQNTRGRNLYPPENYTQAFGILTAKKIPQIPLFPVFTRSGEVTVSLVELVNDLIHDEAQLKKLNRFHRYLFKRVLRLEKDPMEYNAETAQCGYLVVPINTENLIIDWPFVENIDSCHDSNYKKCFRQNSESPEIFEFHEDDFLDSVVMPAYRNFDKPQYFYVAEIRNDLSPRSQFPSQELYNTFEDYYRCKYGINITSCKQPLLDVDHTSARLNLLTPRYLNQKGVALPTSSAQTKRSRRENLQQKQIFIPELCGIHPFPASLWRKAVCIPAILYRTNYLLIASEIRCLISREARIGAEILPDDYPYPKLDFGLNLNANMERKYYDDDNSHEVLLSSHQTMSEIHSTNDLNNSMQAIELQCPSATTDFKKATESICDTYQCAKSKLEVNQTLFSSHPSPDSIYGPSPCLVLQTLTMSNANDFFNLERLETIGDSFLKFAITAYLYCTYPDIHEGKLSHLRSKQVSNINLFKLGVKKRLAECMVSTKFEPTENWLPSCYVIRTDGHIGSVHFPESSGQSNMLESHNEGGLLDPQGQIKAFDKEMEYITMSTEEKNEAISVSSDQVIIPYNLQTQHSLPKKKKVPTATLR